MDSEISINQGFGGNNQW